MPSRRAGVARAVGAAGLALGLVVLAHAARPRPIDASTGLPELDLSEAGRDGAPPPELSEGLPMVSVDSDPAASVDAFLYAVRLAEHSRADVLAGRDWSTFYGGARFYDLSDHPVMTGELHGVPLPAAWCVAAGFPEGLCVSTAAGAFQFNVPTWQEVRTWGGPPLPDFTPESQQEGARRLLRKIGAADALARGLFYTALHLAASRWASLPGSRAGQPVRSLDEFAAAYAQGLELLA